jgi:hypothetical protein
MYTASELLGTELNVQAVVYMLNPMRHSRQLKYYDFKPHANALSFSVEHGGIMHLN